jgi:hypothetical protein
MPKLAELTEKVVFGDVCDVQNRLGTTAAFHSAITGADQGKRWHDCSQFGATFVGVDVQHLLGDVRRLGRQVEQAHPV